MTQPVVMWFRQDLRLADHPALTAAAAAGPVVPLFILDDASPGAWKMGGASRWWLHKSLAAFAGKVPLHLRSGHTLAVLERLIDEVRPAALYFTRDYAPWSAALENGVKNLCDQKGVACHRHGGFLLHEPESIRNGSGHFFKVYTPFSRACFAKGAPRPLKPVPNITWHRHALNAVQLADLKLLPTKPDWATGLAATWQPGEAGARNLLQSFLDVGLQGYAEGRDRTDLQHTSRLSAHLHWGEISPHLVWHVVEQRMAESEGRLDGDGTKFLKEVLWREFAYHLLHHVPTFPTKAFRSEFEDFPWSGDAKGLVAWQHGKTGYPIVDAGMRELWHTGIMHNRVRMITASFLIKHLLIPWQDGERWFWDTLVDADIANNAASWQWVAGCGADAAPYFRIFNPIIQGEKFDPEGTYVRRWLPALKNVPNAFVHKPWEMATPPKAYPPPIIDHGKARERALSAFKQLSSGEVE